MKPNRYKYLFGPVPSRRLGVSLGVDLVPHKTCTLNCIYCESGSTSNLTIEPGILVPTEAVNGELDMFLTERPQLDFITFSGSGEPTLHSGLAKIVDHLKTEYPEYKLALLTNGTLFFTPGLIEKVQKLDVIIPSLDAASPEMFRKVNRPHPKLEIGKIIMGLIQLRNQYSGKLWLEIFIVPGLNDSDEQVNQIRAAVHQIKPDIIQLNTLDRPGSEKWVVPASREQLEHIARQLDWKTSIVSNLVSKVGVQTSQNDFEQAILQTIKRRPCTAKDLSLTFGIHLQQVKNHLHRLLDKNSISTERLERGIFYKIKD
ncbi:MAG TPA: radical SAM protein [bacterium]|nr:radical SAM protein [bacterium]